LPQPRRQLGLALQVDAFNETWTRVSQVELKLERDTVQPLNWQRVRFRVRADGSGAGLSGNWSSIWGREARAKRANAVAGRLPSGAFPRRDVVAASAWRACKLGPQNAKSRRASHPQALRRLLAVLLAVLNYQTQKPLHPRRRRSGARPVWKTIIHVLLALSSTLDLLRFKFPPYTARPPQHLLSPFLPPPAIRLAPTAPLLRRR
jgi:hypothetical protein